jgi:hypothetical protein
MAARKAWGRYTTRTGAAFRLRPIPKASLRRSADTSARSGSRYMQRSTSGSVIPLPCPIGLGCSRGLIRCENSEARTPLNSADELLANIGRGDAQAHLPSTNDRLASNQSTVRAGRSDPSYEAGAAYLRLEKSEPKEHAVWGPNWGLNHRVVVSSTISVLGRNGRRRTDRRTRAQARMIPITNIPNAAVTTAARRLVLATFTMASPSFAMHNTK